MNGCEGAKLLGFANFDWYKIKTPDVILWKDDTGRFLYQRVYPVELARPAKYNPPAMRVRGDCYTKKITFPI